MNNLPKHLHVIGICGVATSAVAIAFHKKGVKVTGSDKGFFPPVSTELEKHGISFYAGWHPEKMIEHGTPDAIMVGTASGSQNPETLYAKEHGIPMYSYPEIIGMFFVKEHSIVCTGTWGKTSSSALLSHILDHAGLDPTYMFGGVSLSHESSARLSNSQWSVFEGDEYKSSPTDPRAKFFHYKPTHLMLTAVSWDHADLYPTEAEYFDAFKKLLALVPKTGLIVACKDHAGVMTLVNPSMNDNVVLYGSAESSNMQANTSAASTKAEPLFYSYNNAAQTKNGLDLTINHSGASWNVHSPMLGLYQSENIAGCFAMAHQLGIAPAVIIEAIGTFKGLKRRMEKRLDGGVSGVTVIDDIAHSPEKAASVLKTIRSIYTGKIVAVFEPNIGGRQREALAKYASAFKDADVVIIPRLTKLKIADSNKTGTDNSAAEQPLEGDVLAGIIAKTHPNTQYADNDEQLVEHLISSIQKGDVIVFLGSHGFRGMIEEVIRQAP